MQFFIILLGGLFVYSYIKYSKSVLFKYDQLINKLTELRNVIEDKFFPEITDEEFEIKKSVDEVTLNESNK